MKKITILALALSLFSSLSFAGNEGSGGGNTVKSSPELVKLELSHLKANATKMLEYSVEHGKLGVLYKRVEVKSVLPLLHLMHGYDANPDYWIDKDTVETFHFNAGMIGLKHTIEESTFTIKEKEPCMDSGQPSDSSTVKKTGSPICFSVSRLTKVSPSALRIELVGLYLHELAHQYGADEPTAVTFQKIALGRLRVLDLYDHATECFNEATGLNDKELEWRLEANAKVVSESGMMYGLLSSSASDSIINLKIKNAYISETQKRYPKIFALFKMIELDDGIENFTIQDMLGVMPQLWFASNQTDYSVRWDNRNGVYDGTGAQRPLTYTERKYMLMAYAEIIKNLIDTSLSESEAKL